MKAVLHQHLSPSTLVMLDLNFLLKSFWFHKNLYKDLSPCEAYLQA